LRAARVPLLLAMADKGLETLVPTSVTRISSASVREEEKETSGVLEHGNHV
jgi:hypothetical protein